MNKKIRTIFFGTPEFGIPSLIQLYHDQDFELLASVTNPDKPVGRKGELASSAIKKESEKLGIPVLQLDTLKNEGTLNAIKELNPDVCVVVSYGKIIPKEILDIPPLGFINIHPSLLPEYRGATPIQTAILEGKEETGTSIMLIDKEMDHGPILSQEKINIEKREYFKDLSEKIANKSAELLIKTVKEYVSGSITPKIQEHGRATYTKKFSRNDARIDWNRKSEEIYNQVRALNPEPGTWTMFDGKILKITRLVPKEKISEGPGKISILNNDLLISASDKMVKLERVQLEGKKEMNASDFLKGIKDINEIKLE